MTSENNIEDHRRSVCCPNDPTCPWPDACDECGKDWPCPTVRAALAEEHVSELCCQIDMMREAQSAAVDAARADERRRNISHILTRAVINERRGYSSAAYALREVAGLIERGEFDDVAASNE